jgi:hypothetical protein
LPGEFLENHKGDALVRFALAFGGGIMQNVGSNKEVPMEAFGVSLDFNVWTVVCMLLIFLGLQVQIRHMSKKIDELSNKK